MSTGSFGFARVHIGANGGRWVDSDSPGFTIAHIVVFGFICVRLGSLSRA